MIQNLAHLLSPPERFRVIPDPSLPVFETEKSPLELVFRNLVANGIKHHDREDGKVVIAAIDQGDFFEFSVSDDGPGIPMEYQDRVFNMFQKLKADEEMEGTGMGLALVKRIVEHQGGRVSVDSSDGKGATFRFTWRKRAATDGEVNAEDSGG
jgi:signal transduction histidine kinase